MILFTMQCWAGSSEKKHIFSVLKNKNFFALWIGQIISQFGDRLAQMGLVGIYLKQTQGISTTSSVPLMRNLFFFSTLPILIFSPVAGVYIDKWSRRNTLIVTDFLRAALVLLIPLIGVYTESTNYIYVIIFLIFAATCFFTPAKLAFIPNLVPKDQLLAANSLSNITRMIAMIGGVAAGGFIVARLGIKVSFILNSVSFLISGLVIGFVRVKRNPVAVSSDDTYLFKRVGKDLIRGLRFIVGNKEIFILSLSFFVVMGAGGLAYVLITVLITKELALGTEGLAIAAAALGTGMILGSLLYGQFGARVEKNLAILGGTAAAGVCTLIFSGSQSIGYLCLGVFLIGFIASIIMIAANTLCQEITPNDLRGRIFASLEIIINFSFVIFVWMAGILGSRYSPSLIFYGMGVSLLIYGGGMFLIRVIRRAA